MMTPEQLAHYRSYYTSDVNYRRSPVHGLALCDEIARLQAERETLRGLLVEASQSITMSPDDESPEWDAWLVQVRAALGES